MIRGENYTVGDRWPVVVSEVISTPLPGSFPDLDFLSGGILLATLRASVFSIFPGYACDGFTPVIRLGRGRYMRITPTPRCGLFPAVLHDALRQFLETPGCPWKRHETDSWFYDSMIAGRVATHHAGIYHGAVAGPLGTAWITLTRTPDPMLCILPA
jgi:hypothetical protein